MSEYEDCNIVKPVRGMSFDSNVFPCWCLSILALAIHNTPWFVHMRFAFISITHRFTIELSVVLNAFNALSFSIFFSNSISSVCECRSNKKKSINGNQMKNILWNNNIYDTMNYPSYKVAYTVNLLYRNKTSTAPARPVIAAASLLLVRKCRQPKPASHIITHTHTYG